MTILLTVTGRLHCAIFTLGIVNSAGWLLKICFLLYYISAEINEKIIYYNTIYYEYNMQLLNSLFTAINNNRGNHQFIIAGVLKGALTNSATKGSYLSFAILKVPHFYKIFA